MPRPGPTRPVISRFGFADFNHNGTSDVLRFNSTTCDIDLWKIADGQWAGSVGVGAHPAGAVPVGIGDSDHNGVSDIMWRDTNTGHIDNWLMTYS